MQGKAVIRVVLFTIAVVARGETPPSLAIDGEVLVVGGRGEATVSLPMRFEADKEGAGTLEIRSRDGAKATLPVTAAQLAKIRTLALPPGLCDLSLHLAHHRHVYASIRADATHPDAPRRIDVAAAPVIRGIVRGAGGRPIAAARIASFPVGPSVTTDAEGRFAVEIEDAWPDELVVSRSGFGTVRVSLPGSVASLTLPPIPLARAAVVKVRLGRALDTTATVELATQKDEGSEVRVIAAKRVAAGSREAVFDDVAQGSYTLLVRGSGALQCLGRKVVVAAGDRREVEVVLPAMLARGRVTRGGKPFARATVVFSSLQWSWIQTFTAGPAGEFESEVWEPGAYETAVRDDAHHAPFIGRLAIDGAQMITELAIDVPERRVRGRVVDSAGAPVVGVMVTLKSTGGEFVPTIKARTNAQGEFAYTAVFAGEHVLRVIAPGFLRPEPVAFRMEADDRLRNVEVRLQRGALRAIEIVDGHGAPAVGALIICGSASGVSSTSYTDTAGRAELAVPVEGDATLYVVPNEGSLAIRRLRAADEDVLRVSVPSGSASLEIVMLTTEGAALPDVGLLMRYNGELIPPEVGREIERYLGVALHTDANGTTTFPHIPPGVYEFWPYRSEGEAASIVAAALAAPINVNVVTGPNKATIRFRRRQ